MQRPTPPAFESLAMTEQEHRELVEAENRGSILVGVDRVYARKLYTDVPIRRIEDLTGEAVYCEKAVVWISFLGTSAALLASCTFAVLAFRWWAILAIPVVVVIWFVYSSMSARSDAKIGLISLLLVAAIAIAGFTIADRLWTNLFLIGVLLSLWLNRLVYSASTIFLRGFVLRNFRAWHTFEDGLVVRAVESTT